MEPGPRDHPGPPHPSPGCWSALPVSQVLCLAVDGCWGAAHITQHRQLRDAQRKVAAGSWDCLQGIRSFLRTHGHITSTLASVGLASMVYAMLLSSFLWFAIRSGRNLDRKGTYTLSPRARGCQPQEPGFFRRFQEELALHHLSEAGALHDRLGPSRRADGPRLLQDN